MTAYLPWCGPCCPPDPDPDGVEYLTDCGETFKDLGKCYEVVVPAVQDSGMTCCYLFVGTHVMPNFGCDVWFWGENVEPVSCDIRGRHAGLYLATPTSWTLYLSVSISGGPQNTPVARYAVEAVRDPVTLRYQHPGPTFTVFAPGEGKFSCLPETLVVEPAGCLS